MKKIFWMSLMTVIFSSSILWAQEKSDDVRIPVLYLDIDQKCINTDVNIYNMCLKEEFMKILSENFTPEQQVELKKQLDNIEAEVADAEPDYTNPLNHNLKDNPVKIKEFNAQNMNLIWKRLLVDTINSLEDSQSFN